MKFDAHQVCGSLLVLAGISAVLHRHTATFVAVLGAGLAGFVFSDLSMPLHIVYAVSAVTVGLVSLFPSIQIRQAWQIGVALWTMAIGGTLFLHNHGQPDLQHRIVAILVIIGGGIMLVAQRRPSWAIVWASLMAVVGTLLIAYQSPFQQ